MSPTWEAETPARLKRVTALGLVVLVVRVIGMLAVLLPGIAIALLMRALDPFLSDKGHAVTLRLQRGTVWLGLRIIGLRYRSEGKPMRHHGAVVANHASWLDILALGAGQAITFVSKAEVKGWPGIGHLARLTSTVFISRNPREAGVQRAQLKSELDAGRKLLFFPEGTSTDGMRVLPFKSSLFAAFTDLEEGLEIQPVSVVYTAPKGEAEPRFYGWFGDMELGAHMAQVLAQVPQGEVRVIYHTPLKVSDFPDRKSLARALEDKVRSGMPEDRRTRT